MKSGAVLTQNRRRFVDQVRAAVAGRGCLIVNVSSGCGLGIDEAASSLETLRMCMLVYYDCIYNVNTNRSTPAAPHKLGCTAIFEELGERYARPSTRLLAGL